MRRKGNGKERMLFYAAAALPRTFLSFFFFVSPPLPTAPPLPAAFAELLLLCFPLRSPPLSPLRVLPPPPPFCAFSLFLRCRSPNPSE
jgi:hypothetical protein